MRIACSNINNNGISISKELINKAVYKYNGLLGRSLFKLYDLGYQSSPALFDLIDFRKILASDFPKERELLYDKLSGTMALDDELILDYAIMVSDNDEFKNIIKIYKDILVSKKALDAYNTLVSKVKIPKKNDLFKVKCRLSVSGSVQNYGVIPLDNPCIRESFYLEEDETLVSFNTVDILIKEMLKRLGYTEEAYLEHKKSGQAFFIKGVSQDEETRLIPLIISGKIECDGKFGVELTNDIQKYYDDFYSSNTARVSCLSYEEMIFNNALDERIELINQKRKEFGNTPYREFYATTDEIIFAVKDTNLSDSKSYFENNILHLGIATVSNENQSEFSKINTLCGLCGEFMSESTIEERGLYTEGLPVSIKFGIVTGNKYKMSELSYYPIYNVYHCENGSNIEPLLGNDIHILVSDINEVFKNLGVSNKSELYHKFLRSASDVTSIDDVDYSKYKGLVADLATALVYAECGVLDYEMFGGTYTWVTDHIFYRACTEAEDLFRRFEF